MSENTLPHEVEAARERLQRLERAADRQRLGLRCRDDEHEWRSRQTMCAWSGHASFKKRVLAISGVDLPHAGYYVLECIACGAWGLTDYCSGSPEMDKIHDITAEAAANLL